MGMVVVVVVQCLCLSLEYHFHYKQHRSATAVTAVVLTTVPPGNTYAYHCISSAGDCATKQEKKNKPLSLPARRRAPNEEHYRTFFTAFHGCTYSNSWWRTMTAATVVTHS